MSNGTTAKKVIRLKKGIFHKSVSSVRAGNFTVKCLGLIIGIAFPGIGFSENSAPGISPEERIDALIEAKLAAENIQPNSPVDDSTFLRRIYLDLIGRIPTIEEIENFHADAKKNRRGRLIENLLNSEGYVSHHFNFWADILRINSRLGLNETAPALEYAFRLWLKRALRENTPYDTLVRELVTARGHFWENGAIGYYQRDRGMPLENMSNTVRIFLGTRLECAQCHDHPFDHWTQMDYYKMAAFSYGMDSREHTHPNREALRLHLEQERLKAYHQAVGINGFPVFFREAELTAAVRKLKQGGEWMANRETFKLNEQQFVERAKMGIQALAKLKQLHQKIQIAERSLHSRIRYITTREADRALTLPHDYQYDDAAPFDEVAAHTMFGGEIAPENLNGGTIDAYADWMTAEDNPTFTRVIANRLWKKTFGIGIFEPLDEINESTKVSNPDLMNYLEQLLRDLDYNMKAYLGVLSNTRAYQRTVSEKHPPIGENYFFQGPLLRRMTAEQVWDSVVGLVIPEVDSYSPYIKRHLKAIAHRRSIYQNLADMPPKKYIATLLDLGNSAARINSQRGLVTQQLAKARAENNNQRVRELKEKASKLLKEFAGIISSIQAMSAAPKTKEEADVLASFGFTEVKAGFDHKPFKTGKSGIPVITLRPKPKYPKPPSGLNPQEAKEWRALTGGEFKSYLKLGPYWARASELTSPAPRGHFLRDFGQSDRDVIENANNQASIPQALNLLNGPMQEALTNRFAVLGSRIQAAENTEEKVRLIFQSMLSREPTDTETARARAEYEQYGDEASDALVWALLNTQQFLFIQ